MIKKAADRGLEQSGSARADPPGAYEGSRHVAKKCEDRGHSQDGECHPANSPEAIYPRTEQHAAKAQDPPPGGAAGRKVPRTPMRISNAAIVQQTAGFIGVRPVWRRRPPGCTRSWVRSAANESALQRAWPRICRAIGQSRQAGSPDRGGSLAPRFLCRRLAFDVPALQLLYSCPFVLLGASGSLPLGSAAHPHGHHHQQ